LCLLCVFLDFYDFLNANCELDISSTCICELHCEHFDLGCVAEQL
jgi:hypothetical protein